MGLLYNEFASWAKPLNPWGYSFGHKLQPIDHFGTEHFGKSHFCMDVSSPEHFDTCTTWRCRRSGRWTFQHGNISNWGLFGTRNFRHRNILARGNFDTCTFWHSSTGAEMSVPKRPYCFARCQNIHVLKCTGTKISHAEMFMAAKTPCAKMSPC